MEENSELKSKNIQLNSELSMKQFYLKQKQQQITNLSKEKEDLKEEIKSMKGKNR